MASLMRGRSCITTRPAPILRWPTSELPICPSAGRHPCRRCAAAHAGRWPTSRSKLGVRACRTALSAGSSRQPQPSRITSITGRRCCISIPSQSLARRRRAAIGRRCQGSRASAADRRPVLRDCNRARSISSAGRFRLRKLRSLRSAADLPGLPAQHRALAGEAPVIAGDVAALADDAVARHHEAHRVLADRGADRARGGRRADLGGDVGIGGQRGPSAPSAAPPTPAPPNRCR